MPSGSGSAQGTLHENATSDGGCAGDGADYSIKRTVGSICNVIPGESVETTYKQTNRHKDHYRSCLFHCITVSLTLGHPTLLERKLVAFECDKLCGRRQSPAERDVNESSSDSRR